MARGWREWVESEALAGRLVMPHLSNHLTFIITIVIIIIVVFILVIAAIGIILILIKFLP